MFGSLLGLGGGLLIVPLLTLAFGVPLREAVAVSLVAVIVTSTAGAGVYLRRHVANLRLGMVLELFTAMGALAGGLVAFVLDEQVLAGLFAVVLTWVAISMIRAGPEDAGDRASRRARSGDRRRGARRPRPHRPRRRLPLRPSRRRPTRPARQGRRPPTFTDTLSGEGYRVRRLGFGMFASIGAGVVSALLGVGGGIVKVPVMNVAMGVPLKVATATSNMMIGITATSSAVIYLLRGEIDPVPRGADGPRGLPRRVGGLAGRRPHRRPDPALAVRPGRPVHRVRDGAPRPGAGMSAGPARVDEGRPSSRQVADAIETLVARLLVAGTYLAVGLILVGVLGMLAQGIDPLALESAPAFDPAAIPSDLASLRPAGFIWAGIVVVMTLPIGRVVVAGAGFFASGERRLALISALVVLVVALSLVAASQVGV